MKKEEEEKLINQMLNKDKNARNKLVEHNLRLVAHIVKKYDNGKNDIDDLISIGTIGLIKGIDTFSNKNGTRLTTTGVTRSGCMFCMFGVQHDKIPNRFQKMQITHPKQYDYCINRLGCGRVMDFIGVPYKNETEVLCVEHKQDK